MDETAVNQQPDHLGASELGTKEHWDTTYVRELENFSSDPTDEGTIWFEDAGAEEKIAEFVVDTLQLVPANGTLEKGQLHGQDRSDTTLPHPRVLDLGTGNGHLLFALREEGGREMWNGAELVGVDYSPSSVELARKIWQQRRAAEAQEAEGEASECDNAEAFDQRSKGTTNSSETDPIRFMVWDVLNGDPNDLDLAEGFDLVLDKGTFDAVSLSREPFDHYQGRRTCEVFPERVVPLIKPGGYFLVTSCNWTEAELRQWFEGLSGFRLFSTIQYPSFSFGGQRGQSVSSVCFQRVESGRSD
ncbi:MAG: hypothetical protein M1831_000232 [Alyxoria varia]|nr:MAG: hypothetical protein M1831_000232 [Alyxoria varia]